MISLTTWAWLPFGYSAVRIICDESTSDPADERLEGEGPKSDRDISESNYERTLASHPLKMLACFITALVKGFIGNPLWYGAMILIVIFYISGLRSSGFRHDTTKRWGISLLTWATASLYAVLAVAAFLQPQ